MSISRFLKTGENENILSKDEIHHIQKVLRLKVGDNIQIFDGQGEEILVEINNFKPYFEYNIINKNYQEKKLPQITLILSSIKPKNLELILEKVTELGVDKIIITKTKYSQISLQILEEKKIRFQKILIEACKQSGNNYIPELEFIDIKNIKNNLSDINYIATTQYTTTNTILLESPKSDIKEKSYSLFIGPEGGFEQQEYQDLIQYFIPVTFSKNILRVETASILGIGILSQAKVK